MWDAHLVIVSTSTYMVAIGNIFISQSLFVCVYVVLPTTSVSSVSVITTAPTGQQTTAEGQHQPQSKSSKSPRTKLKIDR